jgi:hypothetical protein
MSDFVKETLVRKALRDRPWIAELITRHGIVS